MTTDWNDELQKATDFTKAIIRKDGPKGRPYCVYSEKTGRKFGCYPTREAAEKRLKQLEMFKHMKGKDNT